MVPAFGLALLAACSAAGRARRERAAGGMLYLRGLFCLLLFLFLMGSLGDNRALSPVLLLHSMFYMGGIALLAFWLAALTVAGWSPHKVLDAAQADALYKNALWLILALVFFYHPSTLYASDPDFFSESAAALLGSLSALALLVLGLGRLALARCPAAARPALGAVLVWLALLMLLYSFAVRVDYGMLEGRFLSQAHKLRGALNTAADLFLLPAAWFALRPLLRGERLRGTLPGVMRGLALLLLMLSCGQMLTARRQEAAPPPQSSALPPAYTDRLFRLSGQGRNIIVLMLDMFTGEHMERLLREDPSLAQSLSGFTWYRDTLSAGNRTHRSLPGMLGGRAYDPPAVNAKADRPLEEVRNEAYAVLPNMLLEQGYDVGLAAVSYLVPHLFGRHCPRAGEVLLAQDAESAFLPWRRAASGQAMPVIRGHSAFLAVYGLFKSLPLSLRQGVYSQGRWLRSLHAASLNTESNRALFEAMLAFGSLAPDNTPVFRYIGSNLTHDPWDIDAQGRLTDPSRPHMTRDEDGIVLEHLWAEKAALRLVGTWLDTLKKAGVYDRCQIILISDHGFADAPGLLGLDNLGPLGGADNMRGSALLLLKNFDAQGPLRTDHTPMSTSDLVALICRAQNNLCPGLSYEDPLAPRRTPRLRSYSRGGPNALQNERLLSTEDFIVQGSMYKRENWRKAP
jgi:hypothetical protein